ncbi:MAG: HDOD domain-containing protein [Woeseiaceae bacterium]
MKKIIFVDDEPNILQGLKRMLRPMRHEWEMQFALSAEEALEAIGDDGIDVIVSDMRMPKHDGAWLLAQVREKFPAAARIILSGHAEQEMTIRSVAATHQFLAKPCDAETLRETVIRTCQLRDMMRSERLQKVTAEIGQLPSVPEIYQEMNAEMGKEESSMNEIAKIISRDLGMSAKILQLINSAFFGLRRNVGSIDQAVAYLGMDVIRALVLSESAFKAYDKATSAIPVDSLMRKGQLVAAIAKQIAKLESDSKVIADEVFQAGMMHELGKLILATELADEYKAVINRVQAGESQTDVELECFDVAQGEVGAYLLGLWGLSDGIVEAIAYHRRPSTTELTQFAPIAALHAAAAFEAELSDRDGPELDEAWLASIGCGEKVEAWREIAQQQVMQKDAA